ncbi:hypothetical protein N7495_001546 [Penicillium taxi]|uniref:uncharacterized protein n=1 Tax=Penicillium taxi TaxID=168475 RepID=UPI002545B206|nr:uncharacterized protein N7495_001546 [Penicillium taxi]KAJ5908864.1 hypothetical protein N7495_001546 [Penicillium taxi]
MVAIQGIRQDVQRYCFISTSAHLGSHCCGRCFREHEFQQLHRARCCDPSFTIALVNAVIGAHSFSQPCMKTLDNGSDGNTWYLLYASLFIFNTDADVVSSSFEDNDLDCGGDLDILTALPLDSHYKFSLSDDQLLCRPWPCSNLNAHVT